MDKKPVVIWTKEMDYEFLKQVKKILLEEVESLESHLAAVTAERDELKKLLADVTADAKAGAAELDKVIDERDALRGGIEHITTKRRNLCEACLLMKEEFRALIKNSTGFEKKS